MSADTELLRLYISDPRNGNEVFNDEQLQGLISSSDSDLHTAASKAWVIKAGAVADWYLSQTDGALLSRQQVFDHCMAMAKYHEDHSAAEIVSIQMDSGGGGTAVVSSTTN